MIIKKTKNAVRGVIAGFIYKLITLLFPFAIRTVIIYKLGVEYVGLSSLFSAILNVLNLAELGFSTAVVFSMYKPIAEDDKDSIRALLNAYRKIYKTIGFIVLFVGLAVTPFLKFLINGNYPVSINLYVLFLIYLANTVISYFFFAYKTSLISAHQRNDIISTVNSIINILMYISQIIVLMAFSNYYIYAIFIPCSSLVSNLVVGVVTKKMYPEYFCEGEISVEQKKTIKSKVAALMVHKVGTVVQNSIDSLAISIFFGITVLGIYNNYMYVATAIQGFISIIFQSITAGLGNYVHKESVEKNYILFKRILFINALVVSFCSICLIVLYQPFMRLWSIMSAGDTSVMLDMKVVISLVVLFYVNNIRHACGTYREALGIWDKDKWRPLCISIVNLVGTLICAYNGSLIGIIISTIVAYLFVSLYWETSILYKNYFKKSSKDYFVKILLYTIVCILIGVIVFYTCSFIAIQGVWGFVLKVALCCALTVLLLVISYISQDEFKFYFKKIFKLFRKEKNEEKN